MAQLPGRKHGRALARLATAAIAAALIGTTAGTAVAATAPTPGAPQFPLTAADRSGNVYLYGSDGHGGFSDRERIAEDFQYMTAATRADHNQDGLPDGLYTRWQDGTLHFNTSGKSLTIGGGWDIYDRIFSPDNLTGSGQSDLLARDKSGVLWLYKARPDGTLGDRVRVGRGWDIYTDIVGRGDLNGDGKTDVVAKDRDGVLWFYKGTGNINDPFESRVRIGGGWDAYDALVATGDVDQDGHSDMLARDRNGVLWLYRGNGNQSDPFENRTRIGGGWDQYTSLF
ncbi:FG-GAP repeat domain-containing protein [Streptoverticillium reticulum]|uniref:FG-GAP repeat domain-containing protein n=1 Tax=Streptoverticillium reticulum TaxID=1433415 RepID=UPI0039BF1635